MGWLLHQATDINPKDSQMSVDKEKDVSDMALSIPVRGPGSLQEPETWQQLSSKDRRGAKVLAEHPLTGLIVPGIHAGGHSQISCHSCWPL